MSYYCRTVKFTFISEFAKKSFISQLNSSVNAIDFERGLIQRIFLILQKIKLFKFLFGLIRVLQTKE